MINFDQQSYFWTCEKNRDYNVFLLLSFLIYNFKDRINLALNDKGLILIKKMIFQLVQKIDAILLCFFIKKMIILVVYFQIWI